MVQCKYFKIFELVDPETYRIYGDRCWEFLDYRLILMVDTLREYFGPTIINDWKWGGQYQWSGLRTPACTIGAKMSQHRFGKAADMKFKNATPEEIRQAIKSNEGSWGNVISCVEEDTPTWVHGDVRNCKPIKWVPYK